jgi:hypothetical protein
MMDELLAEVDRLTAENDRLRNERNQSRALVVRSGIFERMDCDCVFTRHESDLCGALTEEELAEAGIDTDHSIGQEPLYDDGGPVCLPCRNGDHSAHQPTLADVCVGCACEVMR